MGAAQDLFNTAVRDRWAPLLRDLGFRGSGRVFTLPDERDWVMLGFQSSSFSDAERVKFTINLLVVGKDAWNDARARSSYLSAKPSPNTLGPHRYGQRVGHLTHGRDHWWWLDASKDPDPLIDEISHVLQEHAVPKLRAEMSDQTPGPRGRFENLSKG